LSGFGFLRVYSCKQKMTDSRTLLSQYARTGSESAFRELVSRYINLVYSTACRLVDGDAESAKDVAQTVFVALANQARTLPEDVMLGGWLHLRTRFAAGKLMRAERRRRSRERQAAEMNAIEDHSRSNLAQIAPVLDEAIGHLDAEDRDAILLRFFERQDFRSVGDALRTSEDAARKRVARALEKLHVVLRQRGGTLSAAALSTTLAAEAVTAAPAGLASAIAATSLSVAGSGASMIYVLLHAAPGIFRLRKLGWSPAVRGGGANAAGGAACR
jgi:RNA polymerase sigma factor (sigma-70 family)